MTALAKSTAPVGAAVSVDPGYRTLHTQDGMRGVAAQAIFAFCATSPFGPG